MGSVAYWWIRTPTGEEFGPIATVGIQRLINENMITTSDEIREESSDRYQRFINCSFFSFNLKSAEKEKTEVEKTEILKSEVVRTCIMRKKIEISEAEPPELELEIESPVVTEFAPKSGFLKKTVFALNIALYMALVVLIVDKFSETNGATIDQPSKRAPASVSKSLKKKRSDLQRSR